MMDKVFLSGIELYAYGGITDAEKQTGQRYRVNVEMELDLGSAAGSDDIADTVHYGDVHAAVVETARSQTFNLLESVANRIALRLLDQFAAERVAVRFEKLLPPVDGVVASAGVQLVRSRAPRTEST